MKKATKHASLANSRERNILKNDLVYGLDRPTIIVPTTSVISLRKNSEKVAKKSQYLQVAKNNADFSGQKDYEEDEIDLSKEIKIKQ